MEVEEKLRNLLLPVFGLSSVDEVKPEYALVNDLGAESIDFVEIIYLIERNFGVVIKTNEIIAGGSNINPDDLFNEGKLTEEGALLLTNHIPGDGGRFKAGIGKLDLFSSFTVRDLANIIKFKQSQKEDDDA